MDTHLGVWVVVVILILSLQFFITVPSASNLFCSWLLLQTATASAAAVLDDWCALQHNNCTGPPSDTVITAVVSGNKKPANLGKPRKPLFLNLTRISSYL